MAQSIDHVKMQIPGTMYYLQLTADRGRWVLALLLRNDVENEVVVPVFSKSGIVKAANELLNNSRLVIDKYPLKNVCDQLYDEAERSLPITHTPPPEEIVDTTELAEMKQKIDLLETTIDNISEELKESLNEFSDRLDSLENERVARLEAELSNNEAKGEVELISSVASRLDKIEESIAETKGDDRVPSILTAIEALESKLSQLEGKSVTADSSFEPKGQDVSGLKGDIGRLAHAFDLINQRLTEVEKRFQKPAPVEGADFQPPTQE
jgi:tetrahydromethanopterin S-methyltransferase subunit G